MENNVKKILKSIILEIDTEGQQDILDMIKFARHIHVAGEGNNIGTCKKCGHAFRHIIHFRYGENIKETRI